ncbi:hypothetical protein CVT26_001879 [Gymnopilus dilepis]|uniref:F-box domain-containing protein n=1 Tax=Gymnopilus dilepis TaxID=231916 RepID=A0A409Y3S4_9AGAR|nr:hypothetical protein CVT26_001879 [Gymnopilus dilepis]
MTDVDALQARLPPELEHIIFTDAALEWDRNDCAPLLLVAKRVHEWILPLVYRVFNQAQLPKFPDFQKYPSIRLSYVGKYAKHLLIGYEVDAESFLSSCPNVRNLALWYGISMPRHQDALDNLRLFRLSAVFSQTEIGMLRRPTFTGLTHLEILSFYNPSAWDRSKIIADLPRLSFLSLPFRDGHLVPLCFEQCPSLRVLLIKRDREYGSMGFVAGGSLDLSTVQDTRLVLMLADFYIGSERDWIDGAHGKADSWATAEVWSLARKGNLLRDSSLAWIYCPFDWNMALTDQGKEWYSGLSMSEYGRV